MADKIVLPSQKEIMERLQKVNMGVGDYIFENFYQLIARESGRELVANDIVMMFIGKIYDFMKDGGHPPAMERILYMYVPQLIDVLVDDKEVATEAKKFYKEATGI